MSLLTLDSDRLVRDAVDAFLEGSLRPDPLPDTLYATKNSRYRIVAGLVHEASDTSLMGAELVGWLTEEDGIARIEPRWEFRARAIFVERATKEVVVTSRVIAKSLVTERALAAQKGTIPPAPPIPVLKQAPSVAPPALLSLGPDIRGPRPPMGSEEEITKVEEFTAVATQDQMEQLRMSAEWGEYSAGGGLLPIRKEESEPHTSPTVRPPAPPPTLRDATGKDGRPQSSTPPPPSSRRGGLLRDAPRAPIDAAPPSSRRAPAPPPSSRPNVPAPPSSRPPPPPVPIPPPSKVPVGTTPLALFDSTDEDVEELSGPDIEVHELAPVATRLANPEPSSPSVPRPLPPMNPPPRKFGK